ncbi:MAG: metallophosphoesterase family protein [Pseudomonadota bacterium]
MRIAVISDIHANLAALEAVLADIDRRGIGDVVNLGDSLSGPMAPGAVADLLMARAIPQVLGNHDRFLIDRPPEDMGLWEQWAYPELTPAHLDWLRAIPATDTRHGILMTHGRPDNDNKNWLHRRAKDGGMVPATLAECAEPAQGLDAEVIVSGHTHMPRVVRVPEGPLLVNPGAVGCPAYLNPTITPPYWAEAGAPDARYAILEKIGDDWHASLMAVPYDPREMQALARAKGAEDWAEALATGWSGR